MIPDLQKKLFNLIHLSIKVLVTLTLGTAILAEPSFAAPQNHAAPQYGGTLRLGWYRKPAPFDPFKVTDTISSPLMDLVFNRLIKSNSNGDLIPDLAKKWEVSSDGLVYTFYLRDDANFHDGVPLTSEDVLYSLRLYSDSKISPDFSKYYEKVSEWKATSKFIFQAKLSEPFSPFLRYLRNSYILPKHALVNPERDLKLFSYKPIGTGPFVFKTSNDNEIRFTANKNYMDGRPYLDQVVMRIFSSKSHVWAAFLRKEIDIVFYVDRKDYQAIGNQSYFKIFRALPPGGYAILFNLKDLNLMNTRIRKAISLAIDRQKLLTQMEHGEGVIVSGPFHPESWAYNPSVMGDSYSPNEALKILEEENKKNLSLNLLVDSNNAYLVEMAKRIRQQLAEVGIVIHINQFSNYSELIKKVYSSESSFQCYMFNYSTGTDPDIQSRFWQTDGPHNLGNYSNNEIDKLFREARISNLEEVRQKLYQQAHEMIASDRPAAFLYSPYIFYAASTDVQNVENLFGPFIPFYLVKDIYKSEKGGDGIGNY